MYQPVGRKVKRQVDKPFIGGHLLEHTTFDKLYNVLMVSVRTGILIKDDLDNEVWLSNSVIRRHFKVL